MDTEDVCLQLSIVSFYKVGLNGEKSNLTMRENRLNRSPCIKAP